MEGPLLSVNPIALRRQPQIHARNERQLTRLETEIGPFLLIEVGATFVGTIEQTYVPGETVTKGQEKGCFHLGGSTCITLLPRGTVLAPDLLEATRAGYELLAKMGEAMASGAERH
jgi:phosphatidylserine decarboxylase